MKVEYTSKGETFQATILRIEPKKYDNKLTVINENKKKSLVPISKLKIISGEEVKEMIFDYAQGGRVGP